MKGRVERPLAHLQRGARDLAKALGNGPAMLRLEGDRPQNQEIERALGELHPVRRHRVTPSTSTGRIADALSKRKGRLLVALRGRDLDANAPVLHLAAVALEADGAGARDREGGFEQLAV